MAETSQPVVLDTQGVLNQIHQLEGNGRKFISTIQESVLSFVEVGVSLEKEGKTEQVAKVRECLKRCLEGEREYQGHLRALSSLRGSYECTLQQTDFKSRLTAQASAAPAQEHESLSEFDQAIWKVNHGDEPMPGQEDEDLLVATQAEFANRTCPLSAVNIHDMVEPVEDSKGYIYEKDIIVQWIKSKGGKAACPVVGTSHTVEEADLKPCHKLRRQQKRRKLDSQNPSQATGPVVKDEINLD
mmetsp:Transcript_41659/g.50518  ORF Transcript_41659/g.50518 Transcript_41659/m.50518 type:complete len:243 (+) Transcript_41659:222-950(+)|eukprot:CAMPEP_0197850172 /NCGR_PEP_ID=MMETSP1438-20131217/14502_1 /TAXON_ID=1461541 /ORGANISM="Pterosperma sp., Strain CCMP1384" /LENGTH=242 /DNA_ID=CAMNT_0043463181 /DNA_START=222 /DNA_END=950 /DNA_ORIENTATION=+